MAKQGIENAYYNTSIFIPQEKRLKFANNNTIFKLIPTSDKKNKNPKY